MKRNLKQKLNSISLIVGVIAFIVMACEVEDLNYWYVPFIGAGVLLCVIAINRKVGNIE